jgi:hypothetical protein
VVVGGVVGPLIGLAVPGPSERHLVPANPAPMGRLSALSEVAAEDLTDEPVGEPRP